MKRLMMLMMLMTLPVAAWGAGLDGITFATSYYTQPVNNTGGASLSVRLPFGTLPSPFEAVMGWKLVPQALEDRLYYSVGGRLSAQGPGATTPDGLLLVGLGYEFHELLGASGGLSRFESRGDVSNVGYFSIDLDFRGVGALIEKVAGP